MLALGVRVEPGMDAFAGTIVTFLNGEPSIGLEGSLLKICKNTQKQRVFNRNKNVTKKTKNIGKTDIHFSSVSVQRSAPRSRDLHRDRCIVATPLGQSAAIAPNWIQTNAALDLRVT